MQTMEEFRRSQVPAFGSWEHMNEYDHLPYSQCFESPTKSKLFRRSYSEDRDFYVTSKLCDNNNVVTPATVIVLPRPRVLHGKPHYRHVKDAKKEGWVVCAVGEPLGAVSMSQTKAVDEDLYKISPELLRYKPKKLTVRGLFSMFLGPCASCKEI